MRPAPDLRDPEYVAYAHLFNDITLTDTEQYVRLDARGAIADHLWELGYRKPAATEEGHDCPVDQEPA